MWRCRWLDRSTGAAELALQEEETAVDMVRIGVQARANQFVFERKIQRFMFCKALPSIFSMLLVNFQSSVLGSRDADCSDYTTYVGTGLPRSARHTR